MDFKNVPKKYRPVPFWSWNEKLSVDESLRQTALMDDVGIGGYFMHARGGLQTEYMGEEWFENIAACVDECQKRGMYAWAYDENGWPSGFGGGEVTAKGEAFWQKYLRVQAADADRSKIPENRIIFADDTYCFYYEVNPFYVDTLSAEVTADFIREIYQPYCTRFGDSFAGFFTDEPQISRNGIPWSLTLPTQYKKAYGESLEAVLPCLFHPVGDYEAVRVKFWKLITELFSKNFLKQIHDFCQAHNVQFTGHLVLEESLSAQLITNGACMPHYEYFDIPGMDWLGRPIFPCLTPLQVGSAAAQMGKKQVLSETFALCGHNVSHDELKRNYEWMMVRGINLLCQHLEGYSLRGIRKRDYPPAMYVQQPWWSDYKVFNDAMSRVGMLLTEGKIEFDTLLMHNMTSAWATFDGDNNAEIETYNQHLLDAIQTLESKHIPFHLGDEILMERHGRVEGNRLIIGKMSYTRVVVPPHKCFLENTERLLKEFAQNGGIIVTADELEANPIIDNPHITYTCRRFDNFTMHYFVNSTNEEQAAVIRCGGYALDIATGEKQAFDGTYIFPVYGSLVVIDDGTPCADIIAPVAVKSLPLDGAWSVKHATENALTLDKCTYWFDGELQQENSYVLNVANRAYTLERAVDICCRFNCKLEYLPRPLYLACETPDIFTITVNGKEIDKTDCGAFRDTAFRKLDITDYVTLGENEITLRVRFDQSPQVYENLRKAKIFESEMNKLTYDMEIEAMYLVGDFGVRCDGVFTPHERDAAFFDGDFVITAPPEMITLKNIERQGYPFFAGELTVSRKFDLTDTDYQIALEKKGVNAVHVTVNGKPVFDRLWRPYTADLSAYLQRGDNEVELTLVNNLRNLLGPHHNGDGESYWVGPGSFFDEPCIWNGYNKGNYTEQYSFVETTVE